MEIIEEQAVPLADEAESPLATSIREASENVARLNDRALAFARERPVVCLVGAVALGFVVGKLAARYS